MNLELIGETALQAALAAGDILKDYHKKSYAISTKGREHNLVTEVDLKAENAIISAIKATFPDHNIFSEEAGILPANPEAPTWLIDPLDGTFNFVHKIPLFAVSIGVLFNNQMICGAVFAPLLDELFFAKRGHGAYLNGAKIQVSKTDSLTSAVLVTGIPYYDQDTPNRSIHQFTKMMALGCPIRDLGSCAIDLSYLAAGRFDGYWMPTVQPWDWAAGRCILEEAGGTLTLYNGSLPTKLEVSPLIASNGHIHQQLQQTLHD